LWDAPAKGTSVYPAAQTRHDDFSSLHITQTTGPDTNDQASTYQSCHQCVMVFNFSKTLASSVLESISMDSSSPGTGELPFTLGNLAVKRCRYALWTYETALIEECNYQGAQPYWDWSLDTSENGAKWEDSPLFDPVFGFGGNSRSGSVPGNKPAPPARDVPVAGDCIRDGLFAKYNSTFGTGFSFDSNPHCIIRNFNASVADASLQ
jgi:hypothetical protein